MRFKKVLAVFLLLLSLFVITSCDNGDVEALKSQNESYISQIEEKDDKIQDLEEQLAQIKAENESLKENPSDSALKEENEKLKSDNAKLEEESNDLKKENESLEESNSTLTTENNNLKQSNEDLTEENNDLKEENEVLNLENSSLINEKEALEKSMNATELENAELKGEIEYYNNQYDSAIKLLNNYESQIQILKDKVNSLENTNHELNDTIDDLENTIESLKIDVNNANITDKEKDIIIADLESQILELSASVESLEAELEELQTKYDEAVNIVTNNDTMTSIIADIDKIRNPLINNSLEISMDDNVELNKTLDDCLERIEKLYYYNKVNENEYNSTANYVNTTRSLLCEKIVSLALSVVGEYEYLLLDSTETTIKSNGTTIINTSSGVTNGGFFTMGDNGYYDLWNGDVVKVYDPTIGYIELTDVDIIESPSEFADDMKTEISELIAKDNCKVTYDTSKKEYVINVTNGTSYEEIIIVFTSDTISNYIYKSGNSSKEEIRENVLINATEDEFFEKYDVVYDYFENINN